MRDSHYIHCVAPLVRSLVRIMPCFILPGFHIMVSGFHIMVSGFHIMVSGCHIMVSGCHIMVSGCHVMLRAQWKYHNALLNVACFHCNYNMHTIFNVVGMRKRIGSVISQSGMYCEIYSAALILYTPNTFY